MSSEISLIANLLAKKVVATLSNFELTQLERWISMSEKNKALYNELTDTRTLWKKVTAYSRTDSASLWKSTILKINN